MRVHELSPPPCRARAGRVWEVEKVTAVRQWTVTVPAPAPWLSANERHKRRPDKVIRLWRDAGLVHAKAAKLPRLRRVHILAYLRFTNNRNRDVHNYYPTLKALVDGLVDYHLVPDDSHLYLVGPDLRYGPTCANHAIGEVVLTITDLDAAVTR